MIHRVLHGLFHFASCKEPPRCYFFCLCSSAFLRLTQRQQGHNPHLPPCSVPLYAGRVRIYNLVHPTDDVFLTCFFPQFAPELVADFLLLQKRYPHLAQTDRQTVYQICKFISRPRISIGENGIGTEGGILASSSAVNSSDASCSGRMHNLMHCFEMHDVIHSSISRDIIS